MSLAARTSWVIERNLAAPLTLAGLAEACGVSRFHLAHVFGQTTGRSVMTHVRGRRLSEAAKALARGSRRGEPSILDLALETGYGSHEAFSRAFRECFGLAPEDVRKRGTLDGLSLTGPVPGGAAIAASVVHGEASGGRTERAIAPARHETIAASWVFVGLSQLHTFEALEAIAGQWARFMPRYGEIEDKADPIPYGIACAIDAEGRLDYLTAVRVRSASGPVPKGLTRLVVAPRTYAVFLHATHVSRIRATHDAIWNDWLPASGRKPAEAPMLERHCATFDPRTGEGGVEIWVPIEV